MFYIICDNNQKHLWGGGGRIQGVWWTPHYNIKEGV